MLPPSGPSHTRHRTPPGHLKGRSDGLDRQDPTLTPPPAHPLASPLPRWAARALRRPLPHHPRSARSVKAKVNARILPAFGDLPLNQVDAELISRWTQSLAADGLSPTSIRTYRALLGLILNAAVTDGCLPHAPTLPAPPIDRPARSSEAWLTRVQLQRLADAIEPRYRARVLTAAYTGARWSELVALRWEDFRPDLPLDDGAVAGPGRLKLRRPATNPTGQEPEHENEETRRLSIHRTVPAITKRLGHASPLVTIRMYQHAASLVEDGYLTLQQLGLLTSPSQ